MIMAFRNRVLHLLFGLGIFRHGIKIGKQSFIREHSVIRRHGGTIVLGNKTQIFPYSRIQTIDRQSVLTIGNNTMIGYRFTCLCKEQIKIGNDCMIAQDVFITDCNHSTDKNVGYNFLVSKPVNIGNHVWIGAKAIILPGITIGDDSIIGAGAVVTKSIPPFSIAVGNPAKVIKKWSMAEKKFIRV